MCFKSEPKKEANLLGLGIDVKIFFFSTFKRWDKINLKILLSWIQIRIRSMQIHITALNHRLFDLKYKIFIIF